MWSLVIGPFRVIVEKAGRPEEAEEVLRYQCLLASIDRARADLRMLQHLGGGMPWNGR